MKVNLTIEDFKYLTDNLLTNYTELLKNITQDNVDINSVDISLDEFTANEIREIASEELIYHFDENYIPTKEGKILELFIDKFFTG